LADACGQVLFDVRAHGADDRNERDRGDGEVHQVAGALTEQPGNDPAKPRWKLLRLQNVIDNNLDRPRLENISERFT
jgi:hypothetical protein